MGKFNNTIAIRKRFKQLMQNDFATISIGRAQRMLEEALGPLPDINQPLNSSWAYIRARVIDETVEDIEKPATFGAPPARETSQGRANIVNFPVFYATFDGRTAAAELKISFGTEFYLSIWEVSGQIPHFSSYLAHADDTNDIRKQTSAFPSEIPSILLKTYSKSSFKKAMQLRSSIFELSNYDLSSRIAHDITHNNYAKSQGVIYPSMIDPNRCNVAINPSYVSENLSLVRVYKQVFSPGFLYRQLARGVPNGNRIAWKDVGQYNLDETDLKYSGSNSPMDIHARGLSPFQDKV